MSAEAKDRSAGQEQRSATREHDVETTSRPHAVANRPQAVPALATLPPALPGIGNFSDQLRRGFAHADGAARADLLTRLQRVSGNQQVQRLLRNVMLQRQPAPATPNASVPPPNASTTTPAQTEDPEVAHFEGRALRFDRPVLYKVLSDIEESKGIDARAEFVGRFRNLSSNPGALLGVLPGNARPGLYHDLVVGLDDVGAQLDYEHEEFTKSFEQRANEAARALLDKSEQTIKSELERFGITGDVIVTPDGSFPEFKLSNPTAAAAMRTAARELVPLAKTEDDLGRESAVALNRLNQAQKDDPFGLMTKPLFEEAEARRKRWLEAADAYEQQRRVKVAAHAALALYAQQPGAVGRLEALAASDDLAFANEIGMQAKQKLSNIEMVRGQIGGRFSVWTQPHLRRVTLDSISATALQREIVERKVRSVARAEADDKLFFSILAIGLGLIAALPTGGGSIALAGIAVAAAAAGAALSLYRVGEELQQNALAIAANGTDFDKAKAISQNEPESFDLALDLVMALTDVFAAAKAFKALSGVVKAAKAGEVRSALRVVQVAEQAGVPGAAKRKIVAEAVAGLKDEAIEEVGKTMARSGGMSQAEYLAKLQAGVGEHSKFKKELEAAAQLLEHVQGRIPDHAREMVRQGRVRVFSEAALIDAFGAEEGARKWKALSYADGFYSEKKDLIFLRSGNSAEDLAGSLIHEATHRVGTANPLRGNDYMSEAIAEFAERDFYISLYHEGGPLAGRPVTSSRIKSFLDMDDAQLMADIEQRYWTAKANLAPEKRAGFLRDLRMTPDDIVKQIFEDIAADYKAKFPHD